MGAVSSIVVGRITGIAMWAGSLYQILLIFPSLHIYNIYICICLYINYCHIYIYGSNKYN